MAITNFEKFSTGGGGGANTIYTADDTIGSGRVATVTDTLKFESVGGAVYGGFVLKPALAGAGANEYAIISYGTREWFWHYRANETYGFGMTDGNTSCQFIFNRGSLNNGAAYSGQCFNIVTGTNTVGLYIEGAGATDATTSVLIENSAATETFRLTDSSEATIKNDLAGTLNALTLENQAGGSTHADCGVKLQFTSDAETGFIALYDSTSGGSNGPTMEIISPLGLNYEAGGTYAGFHHRFKTDTAVALGVTNDGTNAILTSVIGGGGGTYSEFQMAYTGGDYNFIKSQHNTGGKFIFGRENGGTTEYMRIAQDGEVLIGTPTVDSSAILNVVSTTQGFLKPRMTGAQVEAIGSPATGLEVYATNAGAGDVTGEGWWVYNGSNWIPTGAGLTQIHDSQIFRLTAAGDLDDLDTGNNNLILIDPDTADRDFTGVVAPATGVYRIIKIVNVGTNKKLKVKDNETGDSAAANCFFCPERADFDLKKGDGVSFVYDHDVSRWISISYY